MSLEETFQKLFRAEGEYKTGVHRRRRSLSREAKSDSGTFNSRWFSRCTSSTSTLTWRRAISPSSSSLEPTTEPTSPKKQLDQDSKKVMFLRLRALEMFFKSRSTKSSKKWKSTPRPPASGRAEHCSRVSAKSSTKRYYFIFSGTSLIVNLGCLSRKGLRCFSR